MSNYVKKNGLWVPKPLRNQRGFISPGIMPPALGGSAAPDLPTTGLTAHWYFGDINTLFKAYTVTNNPAYDTPATADADVVRAAITLTPAPTSEFVFFDNSDSTKAPSLRMTTPLIGPMCLDFDGSNDVLNAGNRTLTAGQAADVFLSASAGTMMVSFRSDDVPGSNGELREVIGDTSGVFRYGMFIYNDSGTVKLLCNNFDGSYDNAFGDTVAANTNYVGMWRHDGGNIISVLNNGSETTSASGDTVGLNVSTFRIAAGGDGGVTAFNGRILEVAVWNTALSGTDKDDAWAHFMANAGL